MSTPRAGPELPTSSDATPSVRLHGRWLLLARMAWVVVAIMRSVEAVPGGTRVTETGEGQAGGFFWLLPDRLVIFLAERQLKAALDRLKSILEGRS